MAIKNTDLGGTDWTNGEVLSHTDLNDTFDAVVNKKVYLEALDSTIAATTASYTTMFESDISADSALFAYNFTYNIYFFTSSSANGAAQLLITFDDASTDTLTLFTNTSVSQLLIRKGSYSSSKRIDKVEIQGLVDGGTGSIGISYDLTIDLSDGRNPRLGDITYY